MILSLWLLFLEIIFTSESFSIVEVPGRTFEVDYEHDVFLKDGEPFRYISGALHYFQVPRGYWRDRLRKCRAAGLNTVQTYIEWKTHEPIIGKYDFSGENDIEHFIKLAQEEGLLVILRPGPYIDAERDFGGLPPWLLYANPRMRLRTNDSSYTQHVHTWLTELFPRIQPLLYGNGGPVIMVQVENEYGSYGVCDRSYTLWLRDVFQRYVGDKAVLFTTDGNGDNFLNCGPIPGVFITVDFGVTRVVSGQTVETSYDYNAPISESGNLTETYYAIRKLLSEHVQIEDITIDSNNSACYGPVKLQPKVSLFDSETGIPYGTFSNPKTFESLQLYSGFMLYETKLPVSNSSYFRDLNVDGVSDRATVYVDKIGKGVLNAGGASFLIIYGHGTVLSLLVENEGHVCYVNSGDLTDFKGLLGDVTLNGEVLGPWNHTGFPMTDVSSIPELPPAAAAAARLPAFYSGTFLLPDPALPPRDTFVDMSGWGKGVLYVNNRNLGRYWPTRGPQITLYLPAPFLQQNNTFVVFELEQEHPNRTISLVDRPILHGPINNMESSSSEISVVMT